MNQGGYSANNQYEDEEAGNVVAKQEYGADPIEDQDLFPEFSRKIKQTKNILNQIEANNEEISDLKEKHQRAISANTEKDINQELNTVIAQNNELNRRLKDNIEQLSKEITDDKQNGAEQTDIQLKQNAFSALTTKVQDVLQNSQNAQLSYKQGIKNKISRQVRYLDANLTQDQIEDMVDDPQKYNDLLQEKTIGSASIQLKNAVSDIQDKCRDIKKLQQNVEIVHQMFLDMALLVNQHGQQLNDIELNLQGANRNFEKATKNLQKAKEHHKAGRKKMCCIIMFGLVLIIIILSSVIFATK